MWIWSPIKQHLFNESSIWNHSVCACDCDYYTKNVVNNLILTCTDKTLNNVTKINTSKASKLYLIFVFYCCYYQL